MTEYPCVGIYHADCDDGFASAWVLSTYFHGNIELIPAYYNESPPWTKLVDKDVIIADFSYKRDMMNRICEMARTVTVYDHHATAQDELRGLADQYDNVKVVFNMNKSGCMITWEGCFPFEEPRDLLKYIEDGDLFKYELEQSKSVQAALRSYSRDLFTWDYLMNVPMYKLADQGGHILRYFNVQVEQVMKHHEWMKLPNMEQEIPICNAPYFMASAIANLLAKKYHGVAAAYFARPDNVIQFSLRSTKESGICVSDIARELGGGGHPNAAGFEIKITPGQNYQHWLKGV